MKRLSTVVVKLIIADFFLHSGWGLVAPIFAIFIVGSIEGGSIEMIGFASATYWITKSTAQPFLANILDIIKGEKDDFTFLVFGLYASSLIPLGYFMATHMWHIFALEFLRGIAMACVVPAWHGIFTRNINKGWEAFSWSVQSTGLGFASGFAAAFGGIVATFLGFKTVFLFVSILGLTSSTLILIIKNKTFPEKGDLTTE